MRREENVLDRMAEWCEEIAGRAGSRADVEIYMQESRGLQVRAFKGQVEELRYSHGMGIGIRVIREGRLGYAYTTECDWQGVRRASEEAIHNSRYSEPDEHNVMPEPEEVSQDELNIYHPQVKEWEASRKVEMALELEKLTLSFDSRITKVEVAAYADGDSEVFIANSKGFKSWYQTSHCHCYVFPIAEDKGEAQTGFAFDANVKPESLDLERVAREASEMALSLLGAKSHPSFRTVVVLDRMVAAEFVGFLASALNAEAVLKGRSFLAGKEGERVAGELVNLVDDGLMRGGFGTRPFDDEGFPSLRKELIKEGFLVSFLHNSYTASRAGTKSTGNASRSSFREPPRVGASNIYLLPMKGNREDIIRQVQEGVFINQLIGVHAGANPVTGEISLGATGHRIRRGELAEPLREITLAGNALNFLKQVVILGEDLLFLPFEGSLGAPTMAIEGVMVSGRG